MARAVLVWALVLAGLAVPVGAAALSPLLAWRDPIYIAAGFAGVLGFAVMVLQPLIATRRLPVASDRAARGLHRAVGLLVLALVTLHVGGLWLTSPPDVIDALLFVSPTPFSNWGVLAMWSLFAAAALVLLRRRWRLRWRTTRRLHVALTSAAVLGTIVHAVLIQGTMEWWTKLGLCAAALLALGWGSSALRRGR